MMTTEYLLALEKMMNLLREFVSVGRIQIINLSLSKETLLCGGNDFWKTLCGLKEFIPKIEPRVAGFLFTVPKLIKMARERTLEEETILGNIIVLIRACQEITSIPFVLDADGCDLAYQSEIQYFIKDPVIVVRESGKKIQEYNGQLRYFSTRKSGEMLDYKSLKNDLDNLKKQIGPDKPNHRTLYLFSEMENNLVLECLNNSPTNEPCCLILSNSEDLIERRKVKRSELKTMVLKHIFGVEMRMNHNLNVASLSPAQQHVSN